jgi:hypothetical protein
MGERKPVGVLGSTLPAIGRPRTNTVNKNGVASQSDSRGFGATFLFGEKPGKYSIINGSSCGERRGKVA